MHSEEEIMGMVATEAAEAQEEWWDIGPTWTAEEEAAMEEAYFHEGQHHLATIRKALEMGLTDPDGPLPMHTDEWELSKWSQWLHYLKAILCYAAGWHRLPNGRTDYEEIPMALTHSARLYAGWEAEWAGVGKGLFRNWFVRYVHDSDWSM